MRKRKENEGQKKKGKLIDTSNEHMNKTEHDTYKTKNKHKIINKANPPKTGNPER